MEIPFIVGKRMTVTKETINIKNIHIYNIKLRFITLFNIYSTTAKPLIKYKKDAIKVKLYTTFSNIESFVETNRKIKTINESDLPI